VGKRQKSVSLVFGLLLIVVSIVSGKFLPASAQDPSEWLTDDAPKTSRIVDLPADIGQNGSNTDCLPRQYSQNLLSIKTVCTYQSTLGTLTTDGKIQTGENSFVPLFGPSTQSTFIPTTNPSVSLVSLSSAQIGNNIGVYHHLSKSDLWLTFNDGQGSYYTVPSQPDEIIRNPMTGQPLEIATYNVAFSENGEWMLADMPHQGLARIHMTDFSVKLFAAPIEPEWYLGVADPALAVSDDGRYAAANNDIFGNGNLNVYDLDTCDDQLNVARDKHAYCAGKNIFAGQTLAGQPMGKGILDTLPDVQDPVHIRFINDDSIGFRARYAVNGQFRTASFVATAPGFAEHNLGLLGMGDSYISGQGAFDYRQATDTSENTCHLSELSYPFLVGKGNFDSYDSIACSGAKTTDVIGKDIKYRGQVTDKIEEQYRDKSTILAKFLPGYLYQQEFAAEYKPQAILLSVGGDNVGFADIVKQCVANSGGATCFDSYEDRVELLNAINRMYGDLVNAYTTLRDQSAGARMYVVGYPQIAKPGGSCGANVHLNDDEVRFSAQLVGYLDGVVKQAADTAGVQYVDTQHAFDGHRLCEADGGQSAMNGFTVGSDAGITIFGHTIKFVGSESYHPTQLGYQLLAQTIAKQTDNLSAPMPAPAAYSMPTVQPGLDILQGVPSSGRTVNDTYYDTGIGPDFAVRGSDQSVAVDGLSEQLRPQSEYQVVLHSDPITLAAGTLDANGGMQVSVRLPQNVAPGYHTLHIYGTAMDGQKVDIQKFVYVAAGVDDYDGDGVVNDGNPCLLFPLDGQDADRDGVDDACDPDIGAVAPMVSAQTAYGDNFAADAVHATISSSDHTSETPGARVLGDAVYGQAAVLPGSNQTHRKQMPYRLDWREIAKAGLVFTVAATVICYFWQKR
jgi:hypothetical protein